MNHGDFDPEEEKLRDLPRPLKGIRPPERLLKNYEEDKGILDGFGRIEDDLVWLGSAATVAG